MNSEYRCNTYQQALPFTDIKEHARKPRNQNHKFRNPLQLKILQRETEELPQGFSPTPRHIASADSREATAMSTPVKKSRLLRSTYDSVANYSSLGGLGWFGGQGFGMALLGFQVETLGSRGNHAQWLRLMEGGRHAVLHVLPTSKGSGRV